MRPHSSYGRGSSEHGGGQKKVQLAHPSPPQSSFVISQKVNDQMIARQLSECRALEVDVYKATMTAKLDTTQRRAEQSQQILKAGFNEQRELIVEMSDKRMQIMQTEHNKFIEQLKESYRRTIEELQAASASRLQYLQDTLRLEKDSELCSLQTNLKEVQTYVKQLQKKCEKLASEKANAEEKYEGLQLLIAKEREEQVKMQRASEERLKCEAEKHYEERLATALIEEKAKKILSCQEAVELLKIQLEEANADVIRAQEAKRDRELEIEEMRRRLNSFEQLRKDMPPNRTQKDKEFEINIMSEDVSYEEEEGGEEDEGEEGKRRREQINESFELKEYIQQSIQAQIIVFNQRSSALFQAKESPPDCDQQQQEQPQQQKEQEHHLQQLLPMPPPLHHHHQQTSQDALILQKDARILELEQEMKQLNARIELVETNITREAAAAAAESAKNTEWILSAASQMKEDSEKLISSYADQVSRLVIRVKHLKKALADVQTECSDQTQSEEDSQKPAQSEDEQSTRKTVMIIPQASSSEKRKVTASQVTNVENRNTAGIREAESSVIASCSHRQTSKLMSQKKVATTSNPYRNERKTQKS